MNLHTCVVIREVLFPAVHTRQQSFDEAVTKRDHTERHSEPHAIAPSIERNIYIADPSFPRQVAVETHVL